MTREGMSSIRHLVVRQDLKTDGQEGSCIRAPCIAWKEDTCTAALGEALTRLELLHVAMGVRFINP